MTTLYADLSHVAPTGNARRVVRVWLWFVAAMVLAMVIVGGATRLTDSGLSITEWQPLLGALPPMSDADWQAAFAKYREIPQYKLLNAGMSLADFKFIYWWEWSHRLLGRAIGVVFFVPMVAFVVLGAIRKAELLRFIGLFALGGMQGAVGWWMVASGLVNRTDVAPIRLATHLTLAALIFCALIWVASRLDAPAGTVPAARGARRGAGLMIALALVQLFLGGLVAGLDAGRVYDTWPLMGDRFVPAEILDMTPVWLNFFENHATVQFVHRMFGYLVFVAALIQLGATLKSQDPGRQQGLAIALVLVLLVQIALGVATLLLHVPLDLALAHQGNAFIFLGLCVLRRARMA